MPNWCMNRVVISGSEEDIKKLKEQVSSEESALDFNKIVPSPDWKNIPNEKGQLPKPEELKNGNGEVIAITHNFPDGTNDSRWYDWQIKNWGTKWNVSNVDVVAEASDFIEFEFDTAWSPPEPIISKLRELYPDVSISAFFDEPGMEVSGYY